MANKEAEACLRTESSDASAVATHSRSSSHLQLHSSSATAPYVSNSISLAKLVPHVNNTTHLSHFSQIPSAVEVVGKLTAKKRPKWKKLLTLTGQRASTQRILSDSSRTGVLNSA